MNFCPPSLRDKLTQFISEDIGFGDITTEALIDNSIQAEAVVVCNEKAVAAGMRVISILFTTSDCQVKLEVTDGEETYNRRKIMTITGSAKTILQLERTALNVIGRMSGIATQTRKYLRKAKEANPQIKVASTRKTAPGLLYLDKEAVKIGGGDTHRFSLDDAFLVKDNHLRIVGSVEEAMRRVKEHMSFTKKVEVEATSTAHAIQAVKAGADIVMLDNMSPNQVRHTISSLKRRGLRDNVIIEASGEINLANIAEYAKEGVDIVSVGDLTHSVKSINLSLEIVKVWK